MPNLLRYCWICIFIFILSGCNLFETYYTYESDYIDKVEKDFGGKALEPETRKSVRAIFNATELRVSVDTKNRNTLILHRSYKRTSELDRVFEKKEIDMSSEVQRYPDCNYFDEKNWICEDFSAAKYEMRKGELFIRGKKMNKNYALKF